MNSPEQIVSGYTLSFDHGIALECGVSAAIIHNHIVFWLKVNKDKPEAQRDGKIWMYQSQEKMAEFFQFFEGREVKYCIKKLVDAGLLVKANFNNNHFDHTNWYTLPDCIYQKVFTKVQKCTNRWDKNVSIEGAQVVPSDGAEFVPSTIIRKRKEKEVIPEIVVTSPQSLEKLKLSNTLRAKICKEHSVEVIDLAVKRCLSWESRPNDEVGIMTALKKGGDWNDVENKEDILKKNHELINSLHDLNNKEVCGRKCVVGRNYIEFNTHMDCIRFETDSKTFIEDVKRWVGDR